MLARNNIPPIHPRQGLTCDRPLRGGDERVFNRHRFRKLLPLRKRCVIEGAFRRRIGNPAVSRNQVLPVHLPLRCSQTNQHFPGGSSNFPELQIHGRRGAAAKRPHIKRSEFGVAHDHFDLAG